MDFVLQLIQIHRTMIHVAAAAAAVVLAGSHGYANILSTSAAVRPNNSLLVDVQVTIGANVERVSITYQTTGVASARHSRRVNHRFLRGPTALARPRLETLDDCFSAR
jgi:hypothetical protein